MNNKHIFLIVLAFLLVNCKKEEIALTANATNGEIIFLTGKNAQGVILQDLSKSAINGMVHGCANCHGVDGKGKFRGGGDKQTGSITYKDLTNSTQYTPVYTDALIERFIDTETKSNGIHANTGVVYIMGKTDKADLISYLKTL